MSSTTMLDPTTKSGVAEIKRTFREWDRRGRGVITRQDLQEVMKGVTQLTDSDLDRLMKEADKNGNGVIEYEEFVDWLMTPSKVSHARAMLDFKLILRPLFKVYDRNGDGTITYSEFKECHSILQGALGAQGEGAQAPHSDPLDLAMDVSTAFGHADATHDGVVTFIDFAEWMGDHLVKSTAGSGVTHQELEELAAKVAKMLEGVFRHKELSQCEPLERLPQSSKDDDSKREEGKVLERLLANLGKAALQFETLCGGDDDEPAPVVWTEPPVGMSVARLKGMHMSCAPIKVSHVEDVSFDVLCVPSPDGDHEPSKRQWFGEVVRRVTLKNGKHTVERPTYYSYDASRLRWQPLWDSTDFDKALDRLPPELCVFCLLKTEANFGIELDWAGARHALRAAADMDLISREHIMKFETHIANTVRQLFIEQGLMTGISPTGYHTNEEELVHEFLEQTLKVRPRLVMAILTELGIVQVSPVWKDFMQKESRLLLEFC